MYSKSSSEYTHRRSHSDRSSRQWSDYDRREERHETLRDSSRDSFQNYRDGHNNTGRISRAEEYGNSPQSHYSQDSMTRDWSRKSPLRRRMSSPGWDSSERKRRKYRDDKDTNYKYRHESLEKSYSLPSNSYSHDYSTKDTEYVSSHEDDFKYRESSPDSRYRREMEEFPSRKHNDYSGRNFHESYRDEDSYQKKWNSSQDKSRSPYRSPEIYETTRDWPEDSTPSVYQQDYKQNRRKISVNGSSGQSFDSDTSRQNAAIPEKKSSEGFQRFLDVLNKGVNIDVLTKIVTQTPSHHLRPDSSQSSWTPSCNKQPQNSHHQEKSRNLVSSHPQHHAQTPNKLSVCDQWRIDEKDLFSETYLSPEKITLLHEDQQKHKQMQNVLQVIGVDLGFEELGKMSHRIRERLYGKDVDNDLIANKEHVMNQIVSSRHESRSPSSSSSSSTRCRTSPGTLDYRIKKNLGHDQREVHQTQTPEHIKMMGYSSFKDVNGCLPQKLSAAAAVDLFSTNSTYSVSQLPPTPTLQMYSAMNYSPQMYPPPSQAPPHVLPGVGQRFCLPVFNSCPPVQRPNMFPPMLAQMGHLIPNPAGFPQPQLFNPPNVNTLPFLNKSQKLKPQARPRCLQVIK